MSIMANTKLGFYTNRDEDYTGTYVEREEAPPTEHVTRKTRDGGLLISFVKRGQYRYLLRNFSPWILERTKRRRLIDLGSGPRENISMGIAAKLRCSEVVCVDPSYAQHTGHSEVKSPKNLSKFYLDVSIRSTRVPADGLSYLLSQPDNSAIVMANGLFNEPFIHAFGNAGFEQIPEWLEYLKEFVTQIYRVTSTIFFGNGMYPQIGKLCEENRFYQLNPYGPGPNLCPLYYSWEGKGIRKHSESKTPIFNDYNDLKDMHLFLFEK